jgi:uncharacterized protein involved in exopolysaccharide biosynthesis
MFDPERADESRRERSLLSLIGARSDEDAGRRSASLLAAAPPQPAEDAAVRHRQARHRRETLDDPPPLRPTRPPVRGEKKSEPAAAPSETSANWAERFLPAWSRRWLRADGARTETPDTAGHLPGDRHRMERPADVFVVEEAAPAIVRDGPDEHWKPLIDPGMVVAGIAKSKWIIVATTLLGAVLGVTIALSTPKKYEATTELLVDPRDLNLVERDLTQSGLSNEATLAIIENQVRILTSGTVLTKVVDQLNLDSDPEFNGEGSEGGIAAFISNLRSLLSRSDGDEGGDRRHTLAVRNLSEALTVERGGKTFVITISAETKDGEKSALIANTMADVFLQSYGQIQSETAGRAAEELTSRLDDLRKDVEAAERKVESFKSENDLIDAQGRLITDDEIVKLNEQLSVARARTLELNARASSTRSINVDAILGGVMPEELSSPTIQELRAQYAALKSDADRLAVTLGPRHPERMAVEAQLAGARDRISSELRRIVSSTQTELKRAVELEQELAARLAQLKVRQGDVSNELVTLRELERDATAKRAVYEAFLLRARETGEQKDINTANMSVISKAWPPLNANPPSRSTMALTGLMLGFFAGVGFGAMRGAYESLRDTANSRAAQRERPKRDPSVPVAATKGVGRGSAGVPRPAPEEAPFHEVGDEPPSRRPAEADRKPGKPAAPQTAQQGAEAHAAQKEEPMQGPAYAYPPFGVANPTTPAPAAYPVHPQGYPQQQPTPQGYPQQAYPQPGYVQQPGYPMPPHYADPYAQSYAPPAYPQAPVQQAHWPQPHGAPAYHPYPHHGQAPVTYPAYMPPQTLHAQNATPHYAPPPAAPAAPVRQPEPQRTPETQQAPIDEIRSSLREFREAVNDLAKARQRRRYF